MLAGVLQVVGLVETVEADEVVAAPTFPHEFQEALLEQDVVVDFLIGRSRILV